VRRVDGVRDVAVFGNALHLVVSDAAIAPTIRAALESDGILVTGLRVDSSQPRRCVRRVDYRHGADDAFGTVAMNLRRLIAISRKEVIQVLRDTRSLLIVLLMPLMLMSGSVTASISTPSTSGCSRL